MSYAYTDNEQPSLSYYLAYGEPKENTLHIFQRNKADMIKANVEDDDKYFHAKANCEAIQNGDYLGPVLLDIGKEGYDLYRKIIKKENNLPWQENVLDSWQDLGADGYGLYKGLRYKNRNCSDILDRFKIDGLENY